MNFENLTLVDPKSENELKTEFYVGNSNTHEYDIKIVTIKFIGEYRAGSNGNLDAKFMYSTIEFVKSYFNPNGIILDLRELKYEFGDELTKAFGAGKYIAFAVLISDLNKKSIGTLVNFGKENIPATEKEYIYDSFELAWEYIINKIPKLLEKSEKDFEKSLNK